ncbi:hypothetical protein K435DRAFT_802920 [Dendrothele bispora CBS 962.96]|uniref:Uncharacterized protein n=1 Tax=Dendrothele bispora (strain CBS 962.96) TaxID=1314807 RepID=A0A4S8LJB2_DENBC|nr:hypothetical protein K435DRAFT_802920 [Dendrothele bispora CBS 962.96]
MSVNISFVGPPDDVPVVGSEASRRSRRKKEEKNAPLPRTSRIPPPPAALSLPAIATLAKFNGIVALEIEFVFDPPAPTPMPPMPVVKGVTEETGRVNFLTSQPFLRYNQKKTAHRTRTTMLPRTMPVMMPGDRVVEEDPDWELEPLGFEGEEGPLGWLEEEEEEEFHGGAGEVYVTPRASVEVMNEVVVDDVEEVEEVEASF